ncbi:unnamed protein product [Leuciscus chuanchicus]
MLPCATHTHTHSPQNILTGASMTSTSPWIPGKKQTAKVNIQTQNHNQTRHLAQEPSSRPNHPGSRPPHAQRESPALGQHAQQRPLCPHGGGRLLLETSMKMIFALAVAGLGSHDRGQVKGTRQTDMLAHTQHTLSTCLFTTPASSPTSPWVQKPGTRQLFKPSGGRATTDGRSGVKWRGLKGERRPEENRVYQERGSISTGINGNLSGGH